MTARIPDADLEALTAAHRSLSAWDQAYGTTDLELETKLLAWLNAEREHNLDLQAENAALQRQVHEAHQRADTARAEGVRDA